MKEGHSYLKPMQKILTEQLRVFVDLCERHNLQYWLAGGTCLGAVRHKGFIPWDDDLDVYMPQKDYEKLLTLEEEIKSKRHYLVTYYTPGYYYRHTKLCSKDTTIWEREQEPFVFGTFIDIFSLSRTNEDDKSISDNIGRFAYSVYKFMQVNKHYTFSSFKEKLCKKDFAGFIRDMKWLIVKPVLRNVLKRALIKEEATLDKSEGDKMVPYTDFAYGLQIFPYEWFDGYEEATFEGITVRLPKYYDAYLRHLYGDYMQLPPLEAREPKHDHYYINLNEGLTLDEVRHRMSKENKV